jgi:hypothetical protein
MSVPNKQIGWSQEANLLHEVLKQLEKMAALVYSANLTATSTVVETTTTVITTTIIPMPLEKPIIVVTNYSALPAPGTVSKKFYWVSNPQGNKFFGNFHDKGLYYSNGIFWE